MSNLWLAEPDRGTRIVGDPLRYPPTRWADTRGRYLQMVVPAPLGATVPVEIFAPFGQCLDGDPCPEPADGVERRTGPYPVVMIEHGAGASKEMHWQTAQVLAEAGYLVLNVGVFPAGSPHPQPDVLPAGESPHLFVAQAALDFLLSTPDAPTTSGAVNPWWELADRTRVALIGASFGAIATSYLGQVDPRVATVIAYDSCEYVADARNEPGPDPSTVTATGGGCRSRIGGLDPAQLRTSRLAISADYWKATDVPRSEPVDPHHKDEYHRELVARGIDSMQVALRSSVHAEPTYAEPGKDTNTRYGMAALNYFTLAWLEYQLRGPDDPAVAVEACSRLASDVFDTFADRYEVGVGRFDPGLASPGDTASGNSPWTVGGLTVADRLSFTFASGYSLAGGAVASDDLGSSRATACENLPAAIELASVAAGPGSPESTPAAFPWLVVGIGSLAIVGVSVALLARRGRVGSRP